MAPQKSGLFTLKASVKRYCNGELKAWPRNVVMLGKTWLIIVDVAQGSITVSVKAYVLDFCGVYS